MELAMCINYMLTRAQNSVHQYFKSRLAFYDLTPVQYSVLKCLWDSGDQLPSQIAQTICLDSSTVTGILDRMEKKGLIQRVHSITDRRAVNVHILPAGSELQKGVEETIQEANDQVLTDLGAEASAALLADLDTIVRRVDTLFDTPH